MAVAWKRQSLKKLNEKKSEEQTRKDEISEIQDALVEIADIVTMAIDIKEGGEDDG